MGKFGKELIESLLEAVAYTRAPKDRRMRITTWHQEKVRNGIDAADRGDFASDNEVARVRGKFTVR